jgi:hypothetical protein
MQGGLVSEGSQELKWVVRKSVRDINSATNPIPKFKVLVFLIHVSITVALFVWFLSDRTCGVGNRMTSYTQTEITREDEKVDRQHWAVLPEYPRDRAYVFDDRFHPHGILENEAEQCKTSDGTTHCIYKGIMPTVESEYRREDFTLGGSTNMIFLMLTFEWITSSFALDYIANEYRLAMQLWLSRGPYCIP